MISIQYDPGNYALGLDGHAGAGIPGQDLVCCAVSTLVYTMAANVRRMRCRGWLEEAEIQLLPGKARIRCHPYDHAVGRVAARLEAICLGFRILEKEYPEFVRFTIT